MRRSSAYLTEPVFRNYRSETELMRYVKKLERRDISLADSMISLGSCTMKLTPAVAMMPLSLSEFADIHPFVPADQAEGYRELIDALSKDLATITGMAAVSLQPNSGRVRRIYGPDGDPSLLQKSRAGLSERRADTCLGSRHESPPRPRWPVCGR